MDSANSIRSWTNLRLHGCLVLRQGYQEYGARGSHRGAKQEDRRISQRTDDQAGNWARYAYREIDERGENAKRRSTATCGDGAHRFNTQGREDKRKSEALATLSGRMGSPEGRSVFARSDVRGLNSCILNSVQKLRQPSDPDTIKRSALQESSSGGP